MLESLIGALIGGAFTVVGVFIGGTIARKTAYKQENKRLLAEFYAEVFANYANCAADYTPNSVHQLISSIEKAKLFCSPDSCKLLTDLALAVTDSKTPAHWGQIFGQLQLAAKNDLGKA